MNNSFGLSLSWDSSAAETFPGSISCPKPNIPESGIFSFLHIPTTLCMLLPEQFLPFLVVIMKTTHFSRDLCAPWGWRLYSNWRFKYWSEHHATERNKQRESSLCTSMWHQVILLSVHLWTTSGSILGTLITRLGGDPSGWGRDVGRGSSSDCFRAFWTWAIRMYYWVKKYITNIKFKHKI